jgi:amino acid transporter
VLSAVVAVIGVYVVVALGATSLVGAGTIVEQKEVALAAAGKEALGSVGLVLVSVGALFAAASAINATLFATARLARRVADDGDLPAAGHHSTASSPGPEPPAPGWPASSSPSASCSPDRSRWPFSPP